MSKSATLFTFTIIISLLTIAIFTLVCRAADEPTAAKGPDPFKMNQLLGRGVNLGNALDAPSEGEWGVVLKEEFFQAVKDAGFSSIRLPVRWSAHAMTQPPYTINPDFMKRVDWAVNCAVVAKTSRNAQRPPLWRALCRPR